MAQEDSWSELNDDDMAAIAESEEHLRQGQVRPFKEAAEELKRNFWTVSASECRR